MYQPDDSWNSKPSRLRFLDQISPEYLESLETQYATDPESLSADWQFFFEAFRLGQGMPLYSALPEDSTIIDEIRVLEMISEFRKTGHLAAGIDPLGLRQSPIALKLELKDFQLESVDPQRLFQAATEVGLPPSTIEKIHEHLKATYCRSVAVEFQYIRDQEIYQWLKARIDQNQNTTLFSQEQKLTILRDLAHANHFENFLQNNYTGQKRFSIEGAEALIPALKQACHLSSELGADEMIIGMAHRGRLNVLVNLMNKPVEDLLKEFEGAELPENEETTGDVKYHQGFSSDMKCRSGRNLHLSLAPNPSHLEFVNPVVEGMARVKLEDRYADNVNRLVPFLIHGDAAVIGQGIVAETLNLSLLKGYATGGTVHLVINNQIGFTTVPSDSRSSYYCTDLGKAIQCPIFHVNGDDPEAVIHANEIAGE